MAIHDRHPGWFDVGTDSTLLGQMAVVVLSSSSLTMLLSSWLVKP
jgi:hypothetical protein